MLNKEQAKKLADAGLDYYNHNIDTSENYYKKIITTRKFEDRLNTLNNVRKAGLKVCCGGILGMGETLEDRIEIFSEYKANRDETPEGIKIAVPYIEKILNALGICIMVKEGYEADDIIGTLAKKAKKENF